MEPNIYIKKPFQWVGFFLQVFCRGSIGSISCCHLLQDGHCARCKVAVVLAATTCKTKVKWHHNICIYIYSDYNVTTYVINYLDLIAYHNAQLIYIKWMTGVRNTYTINFIPEHSTSKQEMALEWSFFFMNIFVMFCSIIWCFFISSNFKCLHNSKHC